MKRDPWKEPMATERPKNVDIAETHRFRCNAPRPRPTPAPSQTRERPKSCNRETVAGFSADSCEIIIFLMRSLLCLSEVSKEALKPPQRPWFSGVPIYKLPSRAICTAPRKYPQQQRQGIINAKQRKDRGEPFCRIFGGGGGLALAFGGA